MREKRRVALDMKTIKELEAEFGALANVPADDPRINQVEVEKRTKVKKRRGAKGMENNNNAKLDDDDTVIFKDKDRTNLSADNLVKMSRSEMGRMNQLGLVDDAPELNGAIIALSKLGISARDKRKEGAT